MPETDYWKIVIGCHLIMLLNRAVDIKIRFLEKYSLLSVKNIAV